MIGQSNFYITAPIESSGNLFLTGTGFAIEFSANKLLAQTGEIAGLSSTTINAQTGNFYRIESQSQLTDSGVFNYLGPTGRFFPPLLTYEQRTGLFSGYVTTGITPFDGLLVYQMTSGQKLMTVQSGIWKTVSLS